MNSLKVHYWRSGGEFKKGRTPWNKGKHGVQIVWNKGMKGKYSLKHSGQFKIGVTSLKKGSKCSEETKLKISKNHADLSKEKHPNWKGGITLLGCLIRNSDEYKKWCQEVYLRDRWICQECFIKEKRILVHHKIPFSVILQGFLELYNQFSPIEDKETLFKLSISHVQFWDINNGQTLCEDCHKLTDSYKRGVTKWV